MCGIVAFVGKQDQEMSLLDAISALERSQHRGYDSVGMAFFSEVGPTVYKSFTINELKEKISQSRVGGVQASSRIMAHTRLATHGKPTLNNQHPHVVDGIFVVHNGEIYNKDDIKSFLEGRGYSFVSETDTECIPALISHYMKDQHFSFVQATRLAVEQMNMSSAFIVFHEQEQTVIAYNDRQSLLVLETDEGYLFVSDMSGLPAGKHDTLFHLGDSEFLIITPQGLEHSDREENVVIRERDQVVIDLKATEKDGFEHFMLKEIMKQPESLTRSIAGRITPEMEVSLGLERDLLRKCGEYDRIVLIGIGTSYFACQVGAHYFEKFARIPAEVIHGSLFMTKEYLPQRFGNALVILVSQSGETSELRDVAEFLKARNVEIAVVSNVVNASIPRIAGKGVYLKAGVEKAVASTKAFTSQISVLYLMSLMFAQNRGLLPKDRKRYVQGIQEIPQSIERGLNLCQHVVQEVAERFATINSLYVLGMGVNVPVAMEASLKMMEVGYLHAQGFGALEMFHGPRALLNESVPCIALINEEDPYHDRMAASLEKCHATGAPVVAILSESLANTMRMDFEVTKIVVPNVACYELTPFVNIVPAQLLAYYTALARHDDDPDKPRSLSKTVTTR